ncbi:MAG: hypothetical protein B7Z37_28455, partial [Verrucomicrobia bacterium 12-59-8]
ESTPQSSHNERLVAAYAKQAAIEKAYQEYLALPDATTIARYTRLPDSPREGLALIQSAEDEAWRVRVETVRKWEDGVFPVVLAKLETKAGKVPQGARRTHSILGPLLSVYYDELVPKHQAENRKRAEEREHAEQLANEERSKKKAHSKASGEAAPQSEAANATNQKKEHRRMVACVTAFVEWEKARATVSHTDIAEFPKPPGMALKRAHAFLGTLFTASKSPSVKEDLLTIFQENGFPNATGEAVVECLAILKNSIG